MLNKIRKNIAIKDVDSNQKETGKLEKLKAVYLGYLFDKNYFGNDESQTYLVFQPTTSTFTSVTGNTEINLSWRSRALSKESIELHLSSGYNVNPKRKWITNSKIAVNVNGGYSL